MFGRLPKIYRWRTAAVVMIVSVIAGVWFATHPDTPVVVPVGAVMGLLSGILLAYVAVHQARPEPRLARVHRRR
ncbi:MAG: hypothetical protein U0R78_13930 [Nocardioidaceae bacterium]